MTEAFDRNREHLAQLMGGDERGFLASSQVLVLIPFLAQLDLERIALAIQNLDRAHTLGPILDPTAYRDAIYSGRLEQTGRCLRAIHTAAMAICSKRP